MKTRSAGFTLVELVTVIVIGATLLTLALPSFRELMRSSRMTATANDLVADYNLARSEAVKRRVPVTLCQSSDGTNCEDDEDAPFEGWIVFVDDAPSTDDTDGDGVCEEILGECQVNAGDGEVDAGETVLRPHAVPGSIEVAANGLLTVFLPSGFPDADPAFPLTELVMCDNRGNETASGGMSAARGMRISATGRTTISRDKTFIEDELGGCPP